MQKPLISIIIPVYNVEKYLEECLDSVINQTYKNLEIILVDDGSTDKSSKICDKYAQKDSRIKLLHKKNGGVSSARNAGLSLVSGEYIAWVDSDDYVATDYVEYMYKLLTEHSADISSCKDLFFKEPFEENTNTNTISFNSNITIVKQSLKNKNYSQVLNSAKDIMRIFVKEYGNPTITTTFWGKLFKKDLFNGITVVGESFDDTYTLYKILAKCNKYVIGEEIKYFYRYVEASNSRKYDTNQLNRVNAAVKQKEFIINNFPELYNYASGAIVHSSVTTLRDLIKINNNCLKFLNSYFEKIKITDYLKKIYKENIISYLKYFKVPIRDKILAVLAYISVPITIRIYRARFHNDFWIIKIKKLLGII